MAQTHRTRLGLRQIMLSIAVAALTAAATAQTVTVDNSDPEFSILYGIWNTGTYGTPYGDDYNWAETTYTGEDPAAVEWRPDLPQAGAYNITIWYVQGTNRAVDATFTVHHVGGSTPVVVNQQINGETWVNLGTYDFAAGTGGYVTLDNDAGYAVVIADAVRFTLEAETVELTMDVSPAGWGTTVPAEGGPYTEYLNEVVPISAQAGGGYAFHHWTVSAGSAVANPLSPVTTVTMDQDKTVTAVFEEKTENVEFRGFWADAFHAGFKSTAQIDEMVSRAAAGNYNAILPEVLAYQDDAGSAHGAYWNSAILPKAGDIVGGIDPLAYLVQEAHAQGIEVHPWLVAFRVSTTWPPSGNTTLSAHPEWLMVVRGDIGGGPATVSDKYTLDPSSPDVQDYLISIVRELVTNYEIDGVHWDYIRYTDSSAGYPAYTWYDQSGLERFKRITGYAGTPAIDYGPWEDFRRRGVTELVRRAQAEVATNMANPRQPLRHTAALITWGDAPWDFEDTSSWARFQNWREWMEEGFLDAGIPMTYYNYNTYPTWYENWVDRELYWRYDRHIFVGPGIYLNSFANSNTEITYAQAAGADGICTYSYSGTYDGGTDWSWYPYAASTVFAVPAVTPEMPWRDPATATKGVIYGRVVDGTSGDPLDDATLYVGAQPLARTDGNGFYIITELPAAAGGTQVAVTATFSGFSGEVRPAVLVLPAYYTEANFSLGTWPAGDYDVDGDVDLDDSDRFLPCLTGPDNGPPGAGCDLFDFDIDNDTDVPDFAVLQESFGS